MITEVKDRVNIIDVVTAYGLKTLRNKSCCPFHNEDTPSFTIYPDTNSFYCFGCGSGGDAISFVQKYFNLDPLQAAQKLNEDFRLGLAGQALTDSQKRELAEEIQRKRDNDKLLTAYREWERDYYIKICDRLRILEDLAEKLKPHNVADISNEYAAIINEIQILEYHWDILFNGELGDKLALYYDTEGRRNIVEGKRYRDDNGLAREAVS